MSVARTARRRRLQAIQGYRHMARLGHGNNNRPIYHKRSESKLQRKEAQLRERMKQMALRKGMRK